VIRDVHAPESGTVTALDAGILGQAALELGAGRNKATDPIDPRVGFDSLVKVGHALVAGDRIARIHAADEASASRAERSVLAALSLA